MLSTVGLNHLYRVVDADTYRAVREDAWLASAFAPREERTTSRPDWSYTGVYLYGRRTYVEFFEEGDQGPVGCCGLAFAVGRGKTSALADAWSGRLGASRTALVERPTPDGGVPWFHLACAEPDRRDGVHLWSMEYHPDFLAAWHPDLTAPRSTTEADVLDRYAARVTTAPRDDFLLGDVTGIDLSVSRDACRFLRMHLEVLVPVDERPDGLSATIVGTTIRARADETPRGITRLTCSLQREVEREVRAFGSSTLRLDGREGVWSF
jgi:hypothetical protein